MERAAGYPEIIGRQRGQGRSPAPPPGPQAGNLRAVKTPYGTGSLCEELIAQIMGGRCLLALLLGMLLTACSGVPVPPAYTQDELAARCARTGGWWHPGTLIDGHCEYRN